MSRRFAPAFAAALVTPLLFLSAAPTASAAHTCPYLAEGTATRDGIANHARVWWSGTQLLCGANDGGWFTIEIKAPTGALLVWQEFLGADDALAARPDGCVETVDPYVGVGLDPLHPFLITGEQHINLCDGTVTMHYEGLYEDYALVLDVWAPI